ncbi:TetR/AcrR family transcriptional regulator [Shewanella surugensis]|uniref:TetR/AcrR family transcriptional regulator n=1 Tax=Shewanella surugensis TaxID=212020 RepID=A0ABT0LEQ7_9GAMM|nr:TetR/AcrR family transcriptional regulator [Shewanella surugensis]MCL1125970.1 TetR/AcrR family transcriptional regulator [Shewanella surugensis]
MKDDKHLDSKISNNKNNILNESKKLFSQKGFDGTSIGQIAKNAGVTKGLIFHYFYSKEVLWKSVKSAFISPNSAGETLDVSAGLAVFLTKIIERRFTTYTQHPELVRMMLWQHLQRDKETLAGIDAPLYSPTHWGEAINMLQAQGELRDDMTVEMIILFIANSVSAVFTQDYFEISQDKNALLLYQDKIIDCLYLALRPKK